MSRAFDLMATIRASTKRNPPVSGGLRGEPVVNLPCVKCTPLDPVQPEIATRFEIDSPFELLQTMTKATDISAGDLLTVENGRLKGKEYQVRAVGDWDWSVSSRQAFTVLVLEESKN